MDKSWWCWWAAAPFSRPEPFREGAAEGAPHHHHHPAQYQSLSYQSRAGRAGEDIVWTGKIEDTLCGCLFRISARSFYQVNPVQTERLYGKAIEYAGLTGGERVIDAYCGIALSALWRPGIASRSWELN